MTFPKQLSIVLLALLLIAVGMVAVLSLNLDGRDTILGVMAILAGILFLIGR
jgi:hypothetical protein